MCMQTEQQSLGISGNAHRSSGRTLPQLGPTSTEAPPGFKTTGNVSFQPRGIGHSEQATSRKMGWEMLLPSGPSPPHAPPPNAAAAAPFAPPSLGMMGPEVAATPSLSGGIMKDVLLFKNPFDVPRDQLLRFFSLPNLLAILDLNWTKEGISFDCGKLLSDFQLGDYQLVFLLLLYRSLSV